MLKRYKPINMPRKNDSTNAETKTFYDVNEMYKNFLTSIDGLTTQESQKRLQEYGRNEIVEKKESKWKKLAKLFWGPIPLMIEVAALLSLIVAIVNTVDKQSMITWASFALILILLIANALIDFVQSNKAQTALTALKKSMALKANVKRDGKWVEINAAELVPGDIIKLSNGDIIPADIIMVEGDLLQVDQAAMTGESLPVDKHVGFSAYSSTIIKQGNGICLVTRTGKDTFFGQTVDLIQNAETKSQFKESIVKIGKYLIYIAFSLVVVLLIYLSVTTFGHPLKTGQNAVIEAFTIVETLLAVIIAAIPVAMPSVLSITTVIGAKELAAKKAIVNKLSAIQELSGVNILCSDKTGTLTQNKLSLNKIDLLHSNSEDEVKKLAVLATNWESLDAIDSLILKLGPDLNEIKKDYAQVKYTPFNAEIKRTEATIKDNKTGKEFFVLKGASLILINISTSLESTKVKARALVEDYASKGIRTLAIATRTNKVVHLMGIISFVDPLRVDSISVIKQIQSMSINVKMLTGDDEKIARYNAGLLGIGEAIYEAGSTLDNPKYASNLKAKEDLVTFASGFARVFPQHKYEIVKLLQDKKEIVAMTGDGVNDSPALKQADVGFAVDGATDAARSAADIVLTKPGLGVIVDAIKHSRLIFRRMINYINYRIALSLSIVGVITIMTFIMNISPLTPIMVILIALFDDIPIMMIAFDKVKGNPNPTKISVRSVFSTGTIMAIVVIAEILIIYFVSAYTPLFNDLQAQGVMTYNQGALHLFNNETWLSIRSGAMSDTKSMFYTSTVQSIIFLTVVISVQFMLFVIRTDKWFWEKPLPNHKLGLTVAGMQIIAIIIVGLIPTNISDGQFIQTLSWASIAFIWIYCVAFAFIMNVVKILEFSIKKRISPNKQIKPIVNLKNIFNDKTIMKNEKK